MFSILILAVILVGIFLHWNAVPASSSIFSGLAKLALLLLELNEEDTLLDLGSGVGSVLTKAASLYNPKQLYGVDINTDSIVVSETRNKLHGSNIEFLQGNILSQDYSYLGANKVFSNFPIAIKMDAVEDFINKNPRVASYFKEFRRTTTADWAFVVAAISAMRPGGRTVCVMGNHGTINQADKEIRQELIEKGLVEGVIALPSNLLSYSRIPLTMIILSENNIHTKLVDATEVFTEGRRQNSLEADDLKKILELYSSESEFSRQITREEFSENEYILHPSRYIIPDEVLSNSWTLGELVMSINRGAMIGSRELDELVTDEKSDFRYLMIKNINEGLVDKDLPRLSKIDEKFRKNIIEEGSLILSKNAPFKIAKANFDNKYQVLANGNLYVLKINEKLVNPTYVEAFLQSEAGIDQLVRLSKGRTLNSISVSDLRSLRVPKMDIESQERIASEYLTLIEELAIINIQSARNREKKAKIFEEVI